MPLLATKIENNPLNTTKIVPYIKRRLCKFKSCNINFIVLGCTHYFFVKREINNIFKKVEVIDNSKFLVEKIIKDNSFLNLKEKNKNFVKFIFSKHNRFKKEVYKKLFLILINKLN